MYNGIFSNNLESVKFLLDRYDYNVKDYEVAVSVDFQYK